MPFYDLNIPYPASSKTVAVLDKLGYHVIGVNVNHVGKITPNTPVTNDIKADAFPETPNMKIVSRLTLTLEDSSMNYNLANTAKHFNLLAVRPTTEKTLQHACSSLEVDIISLDLSVRLPYYLKHSTLGSAISRGIFLEICYSAGLGDTTARRNLLSNAANLVRVTRGRGLIVSSEASSVLELRGPYDIINLATFWGLSQEKGSEAVAENGRRVLIRSETRREIHKGVIRVTHTPDANTVKRPVPTDSDSKYTDFSQTAKIKKKKQKM